MLDSTRTRSTIGMFFLVCLCTVGYTQTGENDYRIEIEIQPGQNQPSLVPVGELGFILFEISKEKQAGQVKLYFSKYSTDLDLEWKTSINLTKRLELTEHDFFENFLYLIFHDELNQEIQVLKIRPESGHFESHTFKSLKRIEIHDFTVLNDKVYLSGSLKHIPVVLKLDPVTNYARILPTTFKGREIEIQEIFTDENKQQVSIIISTQRRNNNSIIIRTYDDRGGVSEDIVLDPPQQYDFLNGKFFQLDNGEKIIIGTFAYRASVHSQGFYIAKFQGDELKYRKYHSFTDLENFFSFLDEKGRLKKESMIKKKKSKGKDLRIQYRLLVHDVIIQGDQYVMIGEAYYPEYVSNSYSDFFTSYSRKPGDFIFDGYHFTHAVIAGFDNQGALIWDNTFNIHDYKSFDLKRRVKVNTNKQSQDIVLLYALEGMIHKLVINKGQIIQQNDQLELAAPNDLVKQSDLGQAEYWYDNYFIAWGYQKLIKSQEVGQRKRNIFYINKMNF